MMYNFSVLTATRHAFLVCLLVPFGMAYSESYDVFVITDSDLPVCQENDCRWSDETFTIRQYDEVTWHNDAAFPVSVTSGSVSGSSVGKSFDSGIVPPNKAYTYVFEEVGNFSYFSVLQPWMTGNIIVEPASAESSSFIDIKPEEPTCGEGSELVDGVCQATAPEPEEPTCGEGSELVDGVCQATAPEPEEPTCGEGSELVDGVCQATAPEGGGCLIATAAYGTELAPQVQFLREVRDNTVMTTASGMAFMAGFNHVYYSFSPAVADMQRENPILQEAVRAFITPMLSTLSLMTLTDSDSEIEVLGLGISVIALNLGMYIAAPVITAWQIKRRI